MSILDDAKEIIHGQRQEEYGNPSVNISRIARLWSVVFGHDVSMDQVLQCMVLLKVSRWVQGYKEDTVIDLAGYAALAERIRENPEAT